ncbi:adenylyltransferase/sulfurtransferase MoeZ [Occultella glacieicola]|uniref:Adenylyltransferase/sulfurtransferase MoeZ n=1 Tax=Occultella glacieicola TaxID=2518684 RepID=A0ABY2E5Q4_9MICO|nr:ThiF family adenylyltransferase [Occultella glacieicola]TDE94177.1 adenylyltransferase/sulfurtransferase MoeZ [Occultella glacieicola]
MPLPPLVAPGPPLTRADSDRLARHLMLPQVGEDGQRRIMAARVAVVGAGGLGSPVLQYLAAAGVGTIAIIDDDVVERSNLQRQVLHTVADIGRRKVDSAAEKIAELAPRATLVKHAVRLDAGNAEQILGGYDVVLDGTDNFTTRYLVNDTCARLGTPLVWASIFQFDAQVSVFWSRPPAPAAPVTLRDLFPQAPPEGSVPSCAEAGVLGVLCGQVGSVMAAEALKLIAGFGEPLLGRVLVVDALNARWTEVPLRPRATAQAGPGARPAASVPPVPSVPSVPPVPLTRVPPPPGGYPPHPGRTGPARPTPPAPSGIGRISADELDRRLQARRRREDDFELVDVRDPAEFAQNSIPGAQLIPLSFALTEAGRTGLDTHTEVILYCKTGPRADRAATAFERAGFRTAVLAGGIDAWENR